jgi:amino acid permease
VGIAFGGIILNLFFILKRDLTILQKISIIGVFAIIFNVFVITATMLLGFTVTVQQDHGMKEIKYHGITRVNWGNLKWYEEGGWDSFFDQVQSFSSLIFCYVTHQLVFPLISALENPTKRRVTKVFWRVHVTEFLSYFIVGMAGYLLLAEHVKERPINSMVLTSIQTVPISIGKFLKVIGLFLAIPLNLYSARDITHEVLKVEKTDRNHILISLVLTFSGTLIAIFFKKINSYFGILGGGAGVMMAGLIPMICYYKLMGLKKWW